ncbi:MAG: hypothetical protein ISS79_01805 [Phycisphaerae bacterium]|nr:hypothetical protein [Phycisphaerae bacterium]
MSDPVAPIDWNKYRKRIEHEDGLLNARVNVFLVLNALGAAALGLSKSHAAQMIIAIVIMAVNILLGLCTLQTGQVIGGLTEEYIRDANDPIDRRVRKTLSRYPLALLPTPILGKWLPLTVCIGWFVGLVMMIFAS